MLKGTVHLDIMLNTFCLRNLKRTLQLMIIEPEKCKKKVNSNQYTEIHVVNLYINGIQVVVQELDLHDDASYP